MHDFSFNRQSLLRDGKPWFPMMGEIHYARCPADTWTLEAAKMKAGGVDIAATYAFWIHHEAEEGQFDFSGCRNLRRFVACCREAGLYVWLRIGPWCHGEVRNGGFPDWLLAKGWTLRDNDPGYLRAVRRYWTELARQTDGLWHGQGGPIIGLQLENEYGHCGGAGNPAHMDALLSLSRELGMQPAYVSATGWGGAVLGTGREILPVMGAYCDAPWDHRKGELPASCNYLFSYERNDVDIGSDFKLGAHLTFAPEQYPFLTAELGGGMQGTWHRRPYVEPADTAAMSLCKLGSGAALLGYYMYHGGVNPGPGLQEDPSSGGACRLPEFGYDYRAPIRAYGQMTDTLLELKLYAMFLRDFGDRLAPLKAVIPADTPRDAEDMCSPRWAYRTDGHSGFFFVNNHQRKRRMTEKRLTLTMPTDAGDRQIKDLFVPGGAYGFYPVNFSMGDAVLKTAHVTPLCCLNGKTYVFYGDSAPCYALGGQADVLTLSREEALHAWKIASGGEELLVVSEAPLVKLGKRYVFLARESFTYTCWKDARTGESVRVDAPDPLAGAVQTESHAEPSGGLAIALDITDDPRADELWLSIRYEGGMAEIRRDGQKVADDFYDGNAFEVSLRQMGTTGLTLHIAPLQEREDVFMDRPPRFEDGAACRLIGLRTVCEYQIDSPWKASE